MADRRDPEDALRAFFAEAVERERAIAPDAPRRVVVLNKSRRSEFVQAILAAACSIAIFASTAFLSRPMALSDAISSGEAVHRVATAVGTIVDRAIEAGCLEFSRRARSGI
jgi:hypothetical protein